MATNTSPITITPLSNSLEVAQPQALRTTLDFTAGANAAVTIQLQQAFDQSKIGIIQTVYCDNSANTKQVTLTFGVSQQVITVAPGVQGYYPVMFTGNTVDVACTAGTGPMQIYFLNVLIPYQIWSSVSTGGFIFNGSGYLLVSDALLDACIAANQVAVSNAGLTALATTIAAGAVAVSNAGLTALATAIAAGVVAVNQANTGGTPTSRSTSTVAATSTQLMAANAARKFVMIQAPETQDTWVNLRGGTAAISGADCIKIPAGTWFSMTFPEYVTQAAINYFNTTGSLQLNALEG